MAESPQKYNPREYMSVSDVTSIDYSPFFNDYFLAAYADGTISLHVAQQSLSVQRWLSFTLQRLVRVQWSPVRPAQFFALDDGGQLYVFDVLQSATLPIAVETLLDRVAAPILAHPK